MASGREGALVLRPLRRTGVHLGYIVLAARLSVQSVHGDGGVMEGWPVDWAAALAISCYHANIWLSQHGEFDG
jgi:hypothetical protein